MAPQRVSWLAPEAVGAPKDRECCDCFVDFAARVFGVLADSLDLAIALLKYIFKVRASGRSF